MIMKSAAYRASWVNDTVISLRCPACTQIGTFDNGRQLSSTGDTKPPPQDYYLDNPHSTLGIRRCPNPDCHAWVFFIHANRRILATYPAERIDFDTTDIPAGVVEAFEEAITCHANQCFIAAAIMVRKALELLCKDRGAEGKTLAIRIKALSTKVILPPELLSGLDDLRLLGNDAAHIESQEYDKVHQEEVEIGIEVTKEVLKAVYQYSTLMARLKALKKPPPTTQLQAPPTT